MGAAPVVALAVERRLVLDRKAAEPTMQSPMHLQFLRLLALAAHVAVFALPSAYASTAEKAGVSDSQPATLVVPIELKKGEVTGGPKVIKLKVGDVVTLRILSDAADEIHLHGYNKRMRVKPGVESELSVHLNRSGRFVMEAHKTHVELGAIEVYPK